jgi:hypothetical protein
MLSAHLVVLVQSSSTFLWRASKHLLIFSLAFKES